MNYRPERVGKLIREELSALITREFEFPGSIVTITEVEIDRKLEAARVLVSVFPSKNAAAVSSELGKQTGYLARLLIRRINIKPMPSLFFRHDSGPENSAQVEKALLDG